MAEFIEYTNQGAIRNQPINPNLIAALNFLPELGVTMEVFSGGQPGIDTGGPRVGSTRHDNGNAADVFFYRNGRRLDWANPNDRPIFEEIVRRGRANGITGFGAGDNYMQPGSMHIGFGAPAVWGAGGSSANAPDWLRAAYGSAPAGAALPSGNSGQQQPNALYNSETMGQAPVNMLAIMPPSEPELPQIRSTALSAADFAQPVQPNALAQYGFQPGQSPYLIG